MSETITITLYPKGKKKLENLKSYLITGITGFAGAHLAQLLFDEGHAVSGLIRGSNGMQSDIMDVVSAKCFESISWYYGNLEDQKAMDAILSRFHFDGVFHLAAQSHPPTSLLFPLDTMRTNVMGSANLIEAIAEHQPECKIMFCSTSEVYGNSGSDGRLLQETDPLLPSNPYACSKAATDLFMQERLVNKKIKGFITRAFSHTGPRRGKNFSISADAYQVARIMAGIQEPVIEVGNLESVRVVIDVRDCVNAYYLLMENEKSNGGVFNVCGHVPKQMGFFTDELIRLSGMNIEKRASDKYYRKIDIHCQHGDSTRLRELTDWKAEIPIEKTLADLLQYWNKKIGST